MSLLYEARFVGGPRDGEEGCPATGARYWRMIGRRGFYLFSGRDKDGMLRYVWKDR